MDVVDSSRGKTTSTPLRWLRSSALARYGTAAAVTTLALGLRLALEPIFGQQLPYVTLFPAVMVSAWLGGFGPGLLSTLLSAVTAAYLWLEPARSTAVASPGGLLGLTLFLGVGIAISALNEASRRAIGDLAHVERERAVLLEKEQAARHEAATAEEQLRLALEGGRMGTWEWAIGAGSVKWSHGLEAIHGLQPGSFPGTFEAVQREVHPEDRERVARAIQDAVAGGGPYHAEYRIVRADGAVRWVEGIGQVFRNAGGQPRLMVGVCSDVTERKQAEEALKESEARFRSLADSAPVLIWVNSPTGCEYVNQAYIDFLGLTLEAIQGMRWSDYLHAEDRDAYVERYLRAVESREQFEAQFRFKRADGEYRWMKSLGVPRVTAQGDFLGFVGCSVDISDIKRAEEELKDADRRKDEFLAVLSHELRNPINAVVGWAQILKSGGLTVDKVRHGLDVIERNARAEAQLVESLLDLSRISTGKLDLESKPVDLRSVASAAVENGRPVARAKALVLDLETPAEPAIIVGDGPRLEQVLTNLLSNAVKFTPAGGRIGIHLDRVDSQVRVRVVDDGEGIAPEFLPFVFDRFRQADGSKERQYGGLGLGLAVVRELVHAHGGTVAAESAGVGRGSAFTVLLPLRAVAGGAEPSESTADASRTAITGLHVLVVDDDLDARELLAIALEAHGATVSTAPSAAAGLDLIRQHRVDVLVADIGMPDEDGYSFVRRIRERERSQSLGRLPAIAVTAFAAATDREQAFHAGFDLHLPKPVDPEGLVRAIARISPAASL